MLPRHIFLDLDGTLFHSEEDIRYAWRLTLDELKLGCPQFERTFRVGPSLKSMAEMLFPGRGLQDKIIPVFKRYYDASSLPNTLPYPGVDGWLRGLAASGHLLYTLTNKRLAPTEMLVRRYGWWNLFVDVVGSDSFGQFPLSKADMLRFMLERFSIRPADAAMVGDTPEDVRAGREAGVFTVACSWGYSSVDDLRKAEPDSMIFPSDILDRDKTDKTLHGGTTR